MTDHEKHGPLGGCEKTYTSRTGEWTERPADEFEWLITTCALVCGHNVICPTCAREKNDRIELLDAIRIGLLRDMDRLVQCAGEINDYHVNHARELLNATREGRRLSGRTATHHRLSDAGQEIEPHEYPAVERDADDE